MSKFNTNSNTNSMQIQYKFNTNSIQIQYKFTIQIQYKFKMQNTYKTRRYFFLPLFFDSIGTCESAFSKRMARLFPSCSF